MEQLQILDDAVEAAARAVATIFAFNDILWVSYKAGERERLERLAHLGMDVHEPGYLDTH